MNRSGFTLLELLVVLVLIGIAAGMVVPRLTGTHDRLPLNTAARSVAALMRLARSDAVVQGHAMVIFHDPATHRLHVARLADRHRADDGPEFVPDSDPRRTYRLPPGVALSRLVTDGALRLAEADLAVFFPIGNSSGGRLVLTDPNDLQITIDMDIITGAVTLGG